MFSFIQNCLWFCLIVATRALIGKRIRKLANGSSAIFRSCGPPLLWRRQWCRACWTLSLLPIDRGVDQVGQQSPTPTWVLSWPSVYCKSPTNLYSLDPLPVGRGCSQCRWIMYSTLKRISNFVQCTFASVPSPLPLQVPSKRDLQLPWPRGRLPHRKEYLRGWRSPAWRRKTEPQTNLNLRTQVFVHVNCSSIVDVHSAFLDYFLDMWPTHADVLA